MNKAFLSLSALLGAALVSACVQTAPPASEGIGFRQARFEEISAMRAFRACRDEAVQLDAQARASGVAGTYLASARLLENCESELGPNAAGLAVDERVRAFALAVQNHLKGGDVAASRAGLDTFRQAFPDQDLYYPDGTSFVESMEMVLGLTEPNAAGMFSTSNTSPALKKEIRRVQYWTRH